MQEQHPAYSYLEACFRCRELGAALARFATARTLANVTRGLAAGCSASHVVSRCSDVSHGAAEVAKLVLKDLEAPEQAFTGSPTEEGVEVVAALQRAVFGLESCMERSLPQAVFLATLTQAVHALELVTAALLDVLGPSNCLSLLNVAAACGCVPLRRRARALALRHFSAAVQQDANGLLTMEEPLLLSLLCSGRLQVDSEMEVFRALAAWTEYDTAARQPRLAARLARCVRLSSLALHDLYALGDHPLVASDRQSSQLVAQAVIHMMMGVQLDCPLGLPTVTRRRQPQAAHALPAGAELDCGAEEHLGAHASVFEAAACAFARQRRHRADAAAEATAAALEGLSVDGCCSSAAAGAGAGSVALGLAPGSPPAFEAPTPTAAGAANAAPAVAPTARVRNIGLGKRVGSRRMLFDTAADCSGSSSSSSSEGNVGSKSAAAEPAAVPAGLHVAAAAGASCMVGAVALEMAMSPNHASVRALEAVAAAAAAPLAAAAWAGRKRLRFD
ncbi:hypothetical protein ABPG75_003873 [Micractinium tetrahymenae]